MSENTVWFSGHLRFMVTNFKWDQQVWLYFFPQPCLSVQLPPKFWRKILSNLEFYVFLNSPLWNQGEIINNFKHTRFQKSYPHAHIHGKLLTVPHQDEDINWEKERQEITGNRKSNRTELKGITKRRWRESRAWQLSVYYRGQPGNIRRGTCAGRWKEQNM